MTKTSKHSKPFINFNKKTIISFLITVSFIVAFISVRAAFFGMGNRKGVAVASDYYFTSNVLSAKTNEDFNNYTVNTSSSDSVTINFAIKNYNSKKQHTPIDITYNLYYCLSKKDDSHKYSISYLNNSEKVTSTEWTKLGSYTLNSSDLNSNNFTVSFSFNGQNDINNLSRICVKAEPTEPKVLSNKVIGARIGIDKSQSEFNVQGYFAFEKIENPDIKNISGFVYNFSTSGFIKSDKKYNIIITWNSDKLLIDSKNDLANNISYDSEKKTGTITIPAEEDMFKSITFYRADGWLDTITLDDLKTSQYLTISNALES